ncbi:tRNA-dihydrouridine(20a/20b) synthase [NAD(P)+]-like protein [Phlyctochytrium bullatum]|nr:tRNA-dihydrouridine(20a/20b) synthase [NAD(P)+]-like protein [Phlyctochytrium bullatum]
MVPPSTSKPSPSSITPISTTPLPAPAPSEKTGSSSSPEGSVINSATEKASIAQRRGSATALAISTDVTKLRHKQQQQKPAQAPQASAAARPTADSAKHLTRTTLSASPVATSRPSARSIRSEDSLDQGDSALEPPPFASPAPEPPVKQMAETSPANRVRSRSVAGGEVPSRELAELHSGDLGEFRLAGGGEASAGLSLLARAGSSTAVSRASETAANPALASIIAQDEVQRGRARTISSPAGLDHGRSPSEARSIASSPSCTFSPVRKRKVDQGPVVRDRYGFKRSFEHVSKEDQDSFNMYYAKCWLYYSGAQKDLEENPGLYSMLSYREEQDRGHGYTRETNKIMEFIEIIERDLHRTFPENIHFNPTPPELRPDGSFSHLPAAEPAKSPSSASSIRSAATSPKPLNPYIRSLRRVLVAFAYYSWPHPDENKTPPRSCTYRIGYCQSLNFIAGLLLLIDARTSGAGGVSGTTSEGGMAFGSGDEETALKVEERTFWLLVAIVERLLPPETYGASLEGAQVAQEVLWNWLLGEKGTKFGVARVAKWVNTLDSDGFGPPPAATANGGTVRRIGGPGSRRGKSKSRGSIPPLSMVTTSWFMTLFVNVLPVETVLRVWDSFFFQGEKVLMRVTLTLIKIHEDQVLACSDPTEAWKVVKSIPPRMIDCHRLMEICFKPRLSLNPFDHDSTASAPSSAQPSRGGSASSLAVDKTGTSSGNHEDSEEDPEGHSSPVIMNDPLRGYSEGGAVIPMDRRLAKYHRRGVGSVPSKLIKSTMAESSTPERIRGRDFKDIGYYAEDDPEPEVDGFEAEQEGREQKLRAPLPPRTSVLEVLEKRKAEGGYLRIAAPMVRYSKLPFRDVVRMFDVDVAFTPMILSDVFKKSQIARDCDFTTNAADDPVIVQFAASKPVDLADASQLVAPHASGVDLNCGCPQKWAIAEEIGCFLMDEPELIKEMVRQTRDRLVASPARLSNGQSASCSIKIRVHPDIRQTVELVKRAESVGVDWITVHGRTKKMRSTEPVQLDAIKTVKEMATVPIFANGDIFTLKDADETVAYTGCDGVMAARGLLENPALFSGYEVTPRLAIEAYARAGIGYGSSHFIYHHHLMYMTEKSMCRAAKKNFNILSSIPACLDYLEEHFGIDLSKRPPWPWKVPPGKTIHDLVNEFHEVPEYGKDK